MTTYYNAQGGDVFIRRHTRVPWGNFTLLTNA